MDCLFCKIAGGEIPNYTVYEDKYALAFLDIHPCSKGHAVVIAKKHFEDLSKMPEHDFIKFSDALLHAIKRIEDVLHPDGVNIGINNGPAAGQAVPHVHWHIIPRWTNDGGGSIHSIIRAGEGVDVKEIARLFQ